MKGTKGYVYYGDIAIPPSVRALLESGSRHSTASSDINAPKVKPRPGSGRISEKDDSFPQRKSRTERSKSSELPATDFDEFDDIPEKGWRRLGGRAEFRLSKSQDVLGAMADKISRRASDDCDIELPTTSNHFLLGEIDESLLTTKTARRRAQQTKANACGGHVAAPGRWSSVSMLCNANLPPARVSGCNGDLTQPCRTSTRPKSQPQSLHGNWCPAKPSVEAQVNNLMKLLQGSGNRQKPPSRLSKTASGPKPLSRKQSMDSTVLPLVTDVAGKPTGGTSISIQKYRPKSFPTVVPNPHLKEEVTRRSWSYTISYLNANQNPEQKEKPTLPAVDSTAPPTQQDARTASSESVEKMARIESAPPSSASNQDFVDKKLQRSMSAQMDRGQAAAGSDEDVIHPDADFEASYFRRSKTVSFISEDSKPDQENPHLSGQRARAPLRSALKKTSSVSRNKEEDAVFPGPTVEPLVLPVLPAPVEGECQMVLCQWCSVQLLVPQSLQPQSKGFQKLRCAKCLRVSVFMVPQKLESVVLVPRSRATHLPRTLVTNGQQVI